MEAFVSLELHLDYQMDANLQQIQEIFLLDHLILIFDGAKVLIIYKVFGKRPKVNVMSC
jgi:hypothetical protein